MQELGADMMLTPNLRLIRKLGEGAMGAVWSARNLSLEADVAVKVLAVDVTKRESHLRFEREARAAAQLSSPHLVRIYDYDLTEDQLPFMVMELLHGEDLRKRLDRGPLSPAATLRLVSQLCRALSEAHARGIIHRDIKPANLFLVDNDGEDFLKVCDFGVAKLRGDGGRTVTVPGSLMGTPYYMSPEQLLASSTVDAQADLWAVGVVVYGCLSGALPFDGATLGALSVAVHAGDFIPLTQLRPKLPPAIDVWMRRALAPYPEDRFESARSLALALEAALGAANTAPSKSSTRIGAVMAASRRTAHADLPSGADTAWTATSHRRVMRPWFGVLLVAMLLGGLLWFVRGTLARTSHSRMASSPTRAPHPIVAVDEATVVPPSAKRELRSHPTGSAAVAHPPKRPTLVPPPRPHVSSTPPRWDEPFYPAPKGEAIR